MFKKLVVGVLALIMVGGFVVGAFYIGRDIAEGPQIGQSQARSSRGASAALSVSAPEWREVHGTVVEYDGEMIVETAEGIITVNMGQSAYIAAQDFQAQSGDEVRVLGFDEDGSFTAGQVQNLSNGRTLVLRDDSGRPMWAGRGNGRGRS